MRRKRGHYRGGVSGHVRHLGGYRLSARDLVYSVNYRKSVFQKTGVHKFRVGGKGERVRGYVPVAQSLFRHAPQFSAALQRLFDQPRARRPYEFFLSAAIDFFRKLYRARDKGFQITPADVFRKVRKAQIEVRFIDYDYFFHSAYAAAFFICRPHSDNSTKAKRRQYPCTRLRSRYA